MDRRLSVTNEGFFQVRPLPPSPESPKKSPTHSSDKFPPARLELQGHSEKVFTLKTSREKLNVNGVDVESPQPTLHPFP